MLFCRRMSFVRENPKVNRERELPFIGGILRRCRRPFVRSSESALILRPPPPSSVHRWWRQTVRPMGRVPFGGFCRQIAAARRFSYRNAPNSGKFGRARFFCHIKGNLNFWGLIELTMAGSHVLIIVLLFSHLSVGAKYPQSWRTPPRGSGFAPRRGIGRSTFR